MGKQLPAKLASALYGTVDPSEVQRYGRAQLLPLQRKQTYQRAARNAVRIAATSWTGFASYTVAAGGFWVATSDVLAIVRHHDGRPWELLLAGPLAGVRAEPGGSRFHPTMTLVDVARDEPIIRLGFGYYRKKRDTALDVINAVGA